MVNNCVRHAQGMGDCPVCHTDKDVVQHALERRRLCRERRLLLIVACSICAVQLQATCSELVRCCVCTAVPDCRVLMMSPVNPAMLEHVMHATCQETTRWPLQHRGTYCNCTAYTAATRCTSNTCIQPQAAELLVNAKRLSNSSRATGKLASSPMCDSSHSLHGTIHAA